MAFIVNAGMERNAEKGADSHPAFILPGVNCSLTADFDVDMGIRTGLNDVETDRTFLAGIAAAFQRSLVPGRRLKQGTRFGEPLRAEVMIAVLSIAVAFFSLTCPCGVK